MTTFKDNEFQIVRQLRLKAFEQFIANPTKETKSRFLTLRNKQLQLTK